MFSYKASTLKSIVFLSTLAYTIYNKKVLNFSRYTQNIFKGVIIIEIEFKDRNHIKDSFRAIHSRLENMAFFIIQQTPEKFLPHWLINSLDKYLDRRISELEQESIKMTWHNMYLQNSLTETHNRQQIIKEAPADS